ncbi:MAG: porin [Saprospiraceae bacterium]|nr:porin [Saprospiraceae bacterium]
MSCKFFRPNVAFIFLAISKLIYGQDTIYQIEPSKLELSCYLDFYYSYDFSNPKTPKKQFYFYNYNRHASMQLNLGLLKFYTLQDRYRINISIQAGTYAEDNYTAEPLLFRHIYEAYLGLALSSKKTVWLDAGIFNSHIGFESAISFDNWTLTRSLLAENSPYYLTGLKINYDLNRRFQFAALVCNGWQRIKQIEGNSLPSLGTQFKFTSRSGWIVHWSQFLGTDDPDSTRRMRYFHNFYMLTKVHENLSLICGLDLGFQQDRKGSSSYQNWLGTALLLKYQANGDPWSVSIRAEYFQDHNHVILTDPQSKINITGISANFDYIPLDNILARVELRKLSNPIPIFQSNSGLRKDNISLTVSIAAKFP